MRSHDTAKDRRATEMMPFDGLQNTIPPDLALSNRDVHVWCASLAQSQRRVQKLHHILSAEEQLHARRFRFEHNKRFYIVGRGLLRTLLGYYLDIAPGQLRLSYGTRGKPALSEEFLASGLRFNMAHSHDIALYGIARNREVGIDVEKILPMDDLEQIAGHFFSAAEYETLCALSPREKNRAFFNCWTRKEAYLKACGDGLYRSLDQFSVSFTAGQAPAILSVAGAPREACHWSVRELIPADGYVGALVAEGRGWHLNSIATNEHETSGHQI